VVVPWVSTWNAHNRGGGETRRAPPALWARKLGAQTAEREAAAERRVARESVRCACVRACVLAFVPVPKLHEPRAACVVDTHIEGTDTRVRRSSRKESHEGVRCARVAIVPDGDDGTGRAQARASRSCGCARRQRQASS
jgi:hypothetical protein